MKHRIEAFLIPFFYLACVRSAPVWTNDLSGGSLIGSSFGVPGNQSFDYVIVGGGTAGLALANRLSENPSFSVAVIEAGGFYELDNGNLSQIPLDVPIGTDKNTQNYNPLVDWGYTTTPQKVRNHPNFRSDH
jgi:choline dehydrogenase